MQCAGLLHRSTVNPYLCDLSQGICRRDSLVAVEAVALDGVRALWRRVAWWHVWWSRCRQGAWMVKWRGLWARLSILEGRRSIKMLTFAMFDWTNWPSKTFVLESLTCPGLGAACWGGGWFPVGVLEGCGWWTAPEWCEKDCGAGEKKKHSW